MMPIFMDYLFINSEKLAEVYHEIVVVFDNMERYLTGTERKICQGDQGSITRPEAWSFLRNSSARRRLTPKSL